MGNLKYYLVNKPFQVLSQFTNEGNKLCLKDHFVLPNDIYPVGRLDYDSEGLLLLTNDNKLKTWVLSPNSNVKKTYLVQVEGQPTVEDIKTLEKGVLINISGQEYLTQESQIFFLSEKKLEAIEERTPPIRFRKNIPTTWLEIHISEGKNRQIRKMTAKIGFPTLRLIRFSIGNLSLNQLGNERIIELSQKEVYSSFSLQSSSFFPKSEQKKHIQNTLYNKRQKEIKEKEIQRFKDLKKTKKTNNTQKSQVSNSPYKQNELSKLSKSIQLAYQKADKSKSEKLLYYSSTHPKRNKK